MKESEKHLTQILGRLIVDAMPANDNDPIEDQYRYWSLKIGVELPDMTPDKVSVDKQDKLIPIYKKFYNDIMEVKGEQEWKQ